MWKCFTCCFRNSLISARARFVSLIWLIISPSGNSKGEKLNHTQARSRRVGPRHDLKPQPRGEAFPVRGPQNCGCCTSMKQLLCTSCVFPVDIFPRCGKCGASCTACSPARVPCIPQSPQASLCPQPTHSLNVLIPGAKLIFQRWDHARFSGSSKFQTGCWWEPRSTTASVSTVVSF